MNHISYSPWLLPLSKKTVLGSFVKAAPVSQNQEFTCSEDHYYYLLIRSSCYRIRLFVWLVLICAERKVLLADCWWLVSSERKVLLAGG
jgi:hypothetical protein